MTNKEAIKILQGVIKKPNTKDGYLGQALDIAIKALEQEPCDDCISREEAIRMFADDDYTVNELRNLPSATPQPKSGRWIDAETLDSALWHACSECGETEFYATNFCPNCGAKMEVEE